MKRLLIIAPLLTVIALVGGLLIAENRAHESLDAELREAVSEVAPAKDIRETNVRGRPYLVSAYHHEVSTAYVEMAAPQGAKRERLLVQNLDLGTHRAGAVRTIVEVAYPASEADLAKNAKANSPTLSGKGRKVTYEARLNDGAMIIDADGGASPEPIAIHAVDGSKVTHVQATKEGLVVNLVARDVSLPRAQG